MSNIRNDGMCNQCCLIANIQQVCWIYRRRGREGREHGVFWRGRAQPQADSWLCLQGKNFVTNDEKNNPEQLSALGNRREYGQQIFEGKLPWCAS